MKKITVKHYPNNQLKPEIEESNIYYPIYVSITVNRINVRRKSALNIGLDRYLSIEDYQNDFINKPESRRRVKYEQDLLYRITKQLINDIDNNSIKRELLFFISSKGYNSKTEFVNLLNAYIDFYSYSIFDAVAQHCTNEIEKEIYMKLSNTFKIEKQEDIKEIFQYKTATQEVDFIYNNLSRSGIELFILKERLRSFLSRYSLLTGYDMPLIDWLENKIQTELVEFLNTYKRNKEYYIRPGFEINETMIRNFVCIINEVVKLPHFIELTRQF